jgi:hypothetical protein
MKSLRENSGLAPLAPNGTATVRERSRSETLKRVALLLTALVLCVATAHAADREFSEVVRVIGDECHARPTRIPLFGMVNAFAAVVHPAGAKHIDVAVFENLDPEDRPRAGAIQRAVGASWTPFIQIRSSRDHETVSVYMRQTGHDWKLLLVSIERSEATVVELLLDADGLARWMADPEHSARHWNSR